MVGGTCISVVLLLLRLSQLQTDLSCHGIMCWLWKFEVNALASSYAVVLVLAVSFKGEHSVPTGCISQGKHSVLIPRQLSMLLLARLYSMFDALACVVLLVCAQPM